LLRSHANPRTRKKNARFSGASRRLRAAGVVFGYARVAAAVAPEVTKDGVGFIENAKRVVLDMANARFPAMKIDPSLPPLLPKLDPARAQQVRSILTSMRIPPAQLETLPGFFIASLLYAEGQTKASSRSGRRHSAVR
jgi:hypothetical protein